MPATGRSSLEHRLQDLLRHCGERWGLEGFAQSVRVEWGHRFRRSLGRVHLERRVVRLSMELATAPIAVLLEVLCHESAHLAARDLHGRRCQPHGPEWVALVRAAGFEPRRRIPWSAPLPPAQRIAVRRRRYVHRCPVCQLQRTAWRPVRRWRCAACVAAGLPGRLEISATPDRA
jgi:predicted SprT family Zn-dependent metalloprotease